MEDTLTVTQAHFCPAFMPHEETSFVCQLLAFAAAEKQQTHQANVRYILLCLVLFSADNFIFHFPSDEGKRPLDYLFYRSLLFCLPKNKIKVIANRQRFDNERLYGYKMNKTAGRV